MDNLSKSLTNGPCNSQAHMQIQSFSCLSGTKLQTLRNTPRGSIWVGELMVEYCWGIIGYQGFSDAAKNPMGDDGAKPTRRDLGLSKKWIRMGDAPLIPRAMSIKKRMINHEFSVGDRSPRHWRIPGSPSHHRGWILKRSSMTWMICGTSISHLMILVGQ